MILYKILPKVFVIEESESIDSFFEIAYFDLYGKRKAFLKVRYPPERTTMKIVSARYWLREIRKVLATYYSFEFEQKEAVLLNPCCK